MDTFLFIDTEENTSEVMEDLQEFLENWNDEMDTDYETAEDFNEGEEYYQIQLNIFSKYKNYKSQQDYDRDKQEATAMGWSAYEVYMESTNEYFLWWMPNDDDLEENICDWNSDKTNAPITHWNVA